MKIETCIENLKKILVADEKFYQILDYQKPYSRDILFPIAKVSKDSIYDVLVLNTCDDSDRPTAAVANPDVDAKNTRFRR